MKPTNPWICSLALLMATAPGGGAWAKSHHSDKKEPPAPAATPVPEIQGPLTLEDALALALTGNPRMEAARAVVASARASKRGARAEGMPNVQLGATGGAQGPASSNAGGRLVSPWTVQPSIDATVPIYTGGRVKGLKKGANAQEQAALARVDAEAQALVLQTAEAFLNVLQARQQLDLATALRALDAERLRVAQVRQQSGIAVPLEVSQAEADLAASTQHEIDIQSQLRQSAATLNTLMGRPAANKLELVPLPQDVGNTAAAASEAANLNALPTANILNDRPDLRALRSDVAVAQSGVDVARAARRPLVALRANLLQQIPETLLGGFAWSLGASLVQTLFDGGRSRAQVEAARAGEQRAGAVLAEAEREADEQVEQARAALDAAEKRLAAEDARVVAAERGVHDAQRRVEERVSARLELTEAQTILTRARTDALSARYEAARARVHLAYATGRAFPQTVVTLPAR